MFDKIIHKTISLAFGLFVAILGGYILAAVVCFILAGACSILGLDISTNDIISSIFGSFILLLSLLFFGIIGYLAGEIIQHFVAKFFKSTSVSFTFQNNIDKK